MGGAGCGTEGSDVGDIVGDPEGGELVISWSDNAEQNLERECTSDALAICSNDFLELAVDGGPDFDSRLAGKGGALSAPLLPSLDPDTLALSPTLPPY